MIKKFRKFNINILAALIAKKALLEEMRARALWLGVHVPVAPGATMKKQSMLISTFLISFPVVVVAMHLNLSASALTPYVVLYWESFIFLLF